MAEQIAKKVGSVSGAFSIGMNLEMKVIGTNDLKKS